MKKRLVGILLSIMMLISMIPITAAGAADASDAVNIIRVKLSIGSPTTYSFFIDGNYSIQQDTSVNLDRQLYTVKAEKGSVGFYLGSKCLAKGSTITLKQHAASSGMNNFIYLYNTDAKKYLKYLGDMVITISGESLQIVNNVYIEDYVCGVIPYEMGESYPIEALKAQAVAARSYGYKSIKSS